MFIKSVGRDKFLASTQRGGKGLAVEISKSVHGWQWTAWLPNIPQPVCMASGYLESSEANAHLEAAKVGMRALAAKLSELQSIAVTASNERVKTEREMTVVDA